MSEFMVIPQNVLPQVDILNSCVVKLVNRIESLEKIKGSISLGSSTHVMKGELSAVIEEITLQKDSLKMMAEQLQMVVREYVNTDTRVKDNQINTSVNQEKRSDVSSQNDNSISESIWDKISRLAEKLGLSVMEILAFIDDLKELTEKAGLEALYGNVTDWESWFMKYVPENVSDVTLLGILSLLSVKGLSEDVIKEHRDKNDVAWEKYQEDHNNGKYIENQRGMTEIQYGNHTGDYNTCEVIAAYNALQYLKDGESPDSFPDLLEQFEKSGITLEGELGTSPEALNSYFEENGYDTRMLADRGISPSNIASMAENYDTYIMTAYNDKSNLGAQVHTVNITVENGMYVVHNDYEGTKSYSSLEAAVSGYNDGKAEPISLIGIRNK